MEYIFQKDLQKTDANALETLQRTPIFDGITAKEISDMLSCLNPRIYAYEKGETIATSEDDFFGLGIILEGIVLVAKESLAGNRMIMSVLRQGDMFGEMACFSPNPKWPANISSQTEAEVLFISPERVISQCEKLCAGHQRLIRNLLRIMSTKAMLLNRKVDYLTLKTLRGKLCAFLIEEYKRSGSMMFMLQMNRDEIADFLNVTRPSVSRELGKMRDEGLIDYHKATFKILDYDKLRESVV
ncbi:Crp/Fnr family transcriptional regulator [Fusibacter paucivorans]|uniref:Crp/Fnr family transcriptional regulator n=1 Tax=Fusibacter paucivorans TaxID=76009 RepID=A0ABS5PKN0_9FIRM|nr:Crp/Fnr family transcriptional regulator [Fusibacter paucivorans]MBS7525730.1 Crp/Fnr family transcriptional regulator [Fusibacter paucivorans]